MKNKLFYIICILFSVLSVFLLLVWGEKTGLLTLLSFGGGGIAYYVLDKKENSPRRKNIALIFFCLIFVVVSYAVLPFNHLVDNALYYTPLKGWIVGMAGIVFFGVGLVVSIIKLIKEKQKRTTTNKNINRQ